MLDTGVTYLAEASCCSPCSAAADIHPGRIAAGQHTSGDVQPWGGLAGGSHRPFAAFQEPAFHRSPRACHTRPSHRRVGDSLRADHCPRPCQHEWCGHRICGVMSVSAQSRVGPVKPVAVGGGCQCGGKAHSTLFMAAMARCASSSLV